MAFGGLSLEKEKLNSIYGYDKVTQSMVVSGIGNNDNLLKLIMAAEEKGLDVKEMLKKGDRIGYNAYSFADGGYKYFKSAQQSNNFLNVFAMKKMWDSYRIVKSTLEDYEVKAGLDIKKEKNYATLGRWTSIGLRRGMNVILSIVGNSDINLSKSI